MKTALIHRDNASAPFSGNRGDNMRTSFIGNRVLSISSALTLALSLAACADGVPSPTPVPVEQDPTADLDQDGVSPAQGDCNDLDSSVYPGNPYAEHHDGKDNDCDGLIDEGTEFTDDDGDGYSEADFDCDDENPAINPSALEGLDGIDNNCNGYIDDLAASLGQPVRGDVTQLTPDDAEMELVRRIGYGSFIFESRWIRDLDDDGYDELAVGVVEANATGRIYLIYGGPALAGGTFDIETRADAIIEGNGNPNLTGLRVVGGGDLEGDGYNDLLVGDILHQRVALFSGGARLSGVYYLDEADALFYPLSGVAANVGLGLDFAGDVNGDGFDDLLIGQPGFDNWRGRTQLFFGGKPYTGIVDIEHADASLIGEELGDFSGGSVFGVGDLDGDELSDVLINAPDAEGNGQIPYLGKLYVMYGSTTRFSGSISLAAADAALTTQYDTDGMQVSHGDMNGDGLSDIALGFPLGDRALVLFGKPQRFSGEQFSDQLAGLIAMPSEPMDVAFGASVGLGSDVNGDGFDDLVVAAPWWLMITLEDWVLEVFVDVGYVTIFPGGASLLEAQRSEYSRSIQIQGEEGRLAHVWPVSTGGDFDGDGLGDLAIGSETFWEDPSTTLAANHTFVFTDLSF